MGSDLTSSIRTLQSREEKNHDHDLSPLYGMVGDPPSLLLELRWVTL